MNKEPGSHLLWSWDVSFEKITILIYILLKVNWPTWHELETKKKIWVCVAQWIDHLPGVWEVMGSICVWDSDFCPTFLSCWKIHLSHFIYIKLKSHHLYSLKLTVYLHFLLTKSHLTCVFWKHLTSIFCTCRALSISPVMSFLRFECCINLADSYR